MKLDLFWEIWFCSWESYIEKIILNCFQASSIALIVAASLMLHQPEKYITEWKNMKKSDTVKEMQINEVGENGIERKLKTNVL